MKRVLFSGIVVAGLLAGAAVSQDSFPVILQERGGFSDWAGPDAGPLIITAGGVGELLDAVNNTEKRERLAERMVSTVELSVTKSLELRRDWIDLQQKRLGMHHEVARLQLEVAQLQKQVAQLENENLKLRLELAKLTENRQPEKPTRPENEAVKEQ